MTKSGVLTGKRALVTGASRGIGHAVARAYADAGAELLLSSRDPGALGAAAAEIPVSEGGGGIFTCAADLERLDSASRLAAEVASRWGALDVLVANAGQLGAVATVEEYPVEDWERALRVNLTAPFMLVRKLLPHLRRAPSASIIFVTSGLGIHGRAQWAGYCASKFGLEGLAQVLADELRDSTVRVNLINPGATRTEMRAAAFPEEDPSTLPPVESVVPPFVYLASDASQHIHGERLEARGWRDPARTPS